MRLLSLAFVLYSHSMNSLLFYYFEPVLLRKYRTRDHVLIVKVYQLLWWRTLWVRPKSRRKCRWSRWGVGKHESTHDFKPRFSDVLFLQIHRSLYWKEKLWLNIRMLIKVSFSLATIWSRVGFEITSDVCSEKISTINDQTGFAFIFFADWFNQVRFKFQSYWVRFAWQNRATKLSFDSLL